VRRRGSAEQRLWLGPGEYFCGGRRHFAYAHTHPYTDTYTYSDSFGITYTEFTAAVTHANTYGYGNSYPKGNTEASADSASAALRIG
jgi:hypothetical protein